MALSQADRITFSKAIVSAGVQIAALQNAANSLVGQIATAFAKDQANQGLVAGITPIINAYETEINMLTGVQRWPLSNRSDHPGAYQTIVDSGNLISGNFFYPNNGTSIPHCSGYWLNLVPYATNAAMDANYDGTYPGQSGTYEQQLISSIQTKIATLQVFPDIERGTLHRFATGGTCSVDPLEPMSPAPPYGTYGNSQCTNAGGTWTAGADHFYPTSQYAALAANLQFAIATYHTFLTSTLTPQYAAENAIDTNATRQAANSAQVSGTITAIQTAITTWQALAVSTVYSGTMTAAAFYATTPPASRISNAGMGPLLTALSTRASAVTTRLAALNGATYLGAITQNADGTLASSSGLYGTRYGYLQLRLNLAGGSLFAYQGLLKSQNTQAALIAGIESQVAIYSTLLTCSAFAAPSNATTYISLLSAKGFSIGDNIFIVSDQQPEIARSIKDIAGNRIQLGQPVPAGYLTNANARLYKDLTA